MVSLDGPVSQCLNLISLVALWFNLIGQICFNDYRKLEFYIFIIPYYSIYLIFQFFTTGFRKFMTVKNIGSVLKANIEKKFIINFDGEAYHEESGSEGKYNKTTYKQTIQYNFKSGSDCSAIIIDSEDTKNRRYLNLEFEYIYICVDEMTYKEEREAYNKLSSELCDKDGKYKINLKVITPDMHSTNFVYLTNCWMLFLDRLIYIICIFF